MFNAREIAAKAISEKRCAPKPFGCGALVGLFTDSISVKEYGISGLCQECQDSVFNDETED